MNNRELIARKRELGLTCEEIAEQTGLPLGDVQWIFHGHDITPDEKTSTALEDLLGQGLGETFMMRETMFSYGSAALDESGSQSGEPRPKQQGEYTLEDYYALPEDHRAELIDGVIYDMAAPSLRHQAIVIHLLTEISNYIREHHGECVPFGAPVDVKLGADDRTVVQPDVLVRCRPGGKPSGQPHIPPDLVIEVLSPSTRKKDLYIKTKKYFEAGVRECWIVDPRDERVIVYDYEHEDAVRLYTFSDCVPVGIFDGDLVIDFAELSAYLKRLSDDGFFADEN